MLDDFIDRLFFLNKRKNFSDRELKSTYKHNFALLKKAIGFSPRNDSYYIKALTHSSFLEMYPELKKSNERLEFLGDSVLSMVVGKYLFKKYPHEEEGFLTKSRAALVNRESLYTAAEELGLQNFILYNQKYVRDSLEGLQTILADGLEALIGAIYLDKGLRQTEKFIVERLIKPYEEDEKFLMDTNYKGQLLEFAHAHKLLPPRYIVMKEEGPAHKKEFTIDVYIGDTLYGTGNGKNKKAAEQEASMIAMNKLKDDEKTNVEN